MKKQIYSLSKLLLNPKLTALDSLKILWFWATGRSIRLQTRVIRYPFRINEKLDLSTFFSVVLGDQYAVRTDHTVRYIIDAGANIGTSVVYFASLFPEAKICAIEPSRENFERLKENTKAYRNVQCFCGALAGHVGHVHIQDSKTKHDSFKVSNCDADCEASVPAWDVPACLEMMKWPCVDLLKIDVEGAEEEIFSESADAWINRVNYLFIETHDGPTRQPSKAVFSALNLIDAPIYCRPVGENFSVRRLTACDES